MTSAAKGAVPESARSPEAQRRSRFLISASAALSESLDYERTLQRVAELSVPDIGRLVHGHRGRRAGAAAPAGRGARRSRQARRWSPNTSSKFPPTEHRSGQLAHVLRDRRTPSLSVRVTDEELVRAAQSEDHLRVMRGLGCASCVIVPMIARGEILGVISLDARRGAASLRPRPTSQSAEELAHRAALAIDNARLYREARRREETMRFFAEASTLLSSSLDYVSICERLAHLVVPSFADWCGVELAEEGAAALGRHRARRQRQGRRWRSELRRRYPPDPGAARGPHAVLRTGRPELLAEISARDARSAARATTSTCASSRDARAALGR